MSWGERSCMFFGFPGGCPHGPTMETCNTGCSHYEPKTVSNQDVKRYALPLCNGRVLVPQEREQGYWISYDDYESMKIHLEDRLSTAGMLLTAAQDGNRLLAGEIEKLRVKVAAYLDEARTRRNSQMGAYETMQGLAKRCEVQENMYDNHLRRLSARLDTALTEKAQPKGDDHG